MRSVVRSCLSFPDATLDAAPAGADMVVPKPGGAGKELILSAGGTLYVFDGGVKDGYE